jgi:hypothetical protein
MRPASMRNILALMVARRANREFDAVLHLADI